MGFIDSRFFSSKSQRFFQLDLLKPYFKMQKKNLKFTGKNQLSLKFVNNTVYFFPCRIVS